jgi:hypothetical protein
MAQVNGVWGQHTKISYNFLKRAYSYFSKNFVIVMLLSNIVNISNCESFYLCSPSGIENIFLSISFFTKVVTKCCSNFPTALPLSGWIIACSEV